MKHVDLAVHEYFIDGLNNAGNMMPVKTDPVLLV